jgi:hypothetical protein
MEAATLHRIEWHHHREIIIDCDWQWWHLVHQSRHIIYPAKSRQRLVTKLHKTYTQNV